MTTRLLICGSREASPAMLEYARDWVILANSLRWEIVVGDAEGVDQAVVEMCEELAVPYTAYGISPKARNGAKNYINSGCSGYLARDRYMVERCDKCVAIWNGQSKGTIYTFNYARKNDKKCWLKNYGQATR